MANHPPIDVDSKVGLGPAKLCVNGKELAELSNPAFLCQNAPCKTSKFKVRVWRIKPRSNPTTPIEGTTNSTLVMVIPGFLLNFK